MTIEERLATMEKELGLVKRRNRWQLGAILFLAAGLVVPFLFGTTALLARAQVAGTVKEIRASSFLLVDENGKPRAELSVYKNGPSLVLADENFNPRAMLYVDKNVPRLELLDENNKPRAEFTTGKDGPVLRLRDENENVRAALTLFKNDPMLMMLDENKKAHVKIYSDKDGAGLSVLDENGNPRSVLGVYQNHPGLMLSDENGNVRFWAGHAEISSPDGKTTSYPESSLILFGPDGKVIWSAIK